MKSIILISMLSLILGFSCSKSDKHGVEPGVSLRLAQQRAKVLSDIRYDLAFAIPDSLQQPITGHEQIDFQLQEIGQPLVLDFKAAPEQVQKLLVNGQPVKYTVADEHVIIPAAALQAGANRVQIDFVAGDGSLNRNADYLYTLFVPDRARVAFPCFDQPDLKARFRLRVQIPAEWTAVANTAVESQDFSQGRRVLQFGETPPLSTYLFAFVAGRFQTETAQRDGRTLTFYHREPDREKIVRNRDAAFDLHWQALEFLEDYTGIPFPFEKFDFVLIPSFQYNGMEHPGSVLYRASSVLLDESATQAQLLRRASLIAHETAHMWFGDLVTMKWFNDVWMKEVFANFMAAKIINPSFPELNHDLRFLMAHYPGAYAVDRSAGANPIRQPLENLRQAGTLYGAIIYQKAPIVMRQLELLLGADTFRDGVREYLQQHTFGNADWPDLIALLDRRTDVDLPAWSAIWVGQAGRPALELGWQMHRNGSASLVLRQSDPSGQDRLWPQPLDVLLAYQNRVTYIPVPLQAQEFEIDALSSFEMPRYILANGRGIGYGYFSLSQRTRAFFLNHLQEIDDPLVQGVAWLSLWDEMLEGKVQPDSLLPVIRRTLTAAPDELIVQRLLDDFGQLFWRFLRAETRVRVAGSFEDFLWRQIQAAPSGRLKASYFSAYRRIAITAPAVDRLYRLWKRELQISGLKLAERDETALALGLAVRSHPQQEQILQTQLARITNPDRKARFAFVMPAVSPERRVRDAFFATLRETTNRQHEPWVLEALGYLHHPLRDDEAITYLRPSLDLLQEIQETGDIFFPKRWLDATFSGHNSPEAAAIVRDFLQAHPDYPPRLRGKILQAADLLFRAARIVYSGPAND